MSDEMPKQPTTKQLPAVNPLDELKAIVVAGFKSIAADMALLSGQVGEHGRRLSELEAARQRASDRARATDARVSSSDLSQDAKIADVIVKVEETHALANASAIALAKIAADAEARSAVLNDIALTVGKALKSKLAERIALVGGGALLAIASYYARKYGAPL